MPKFKKAVMKMQKEKTMKLEIEVSEQVDDSTGGHFKHYTETKKNPDEQVRDNDYCTLCSTRGGADTYPECKNGCPQLK